MISISALHRRLCLLHWQQNKCVFPVGNGMWRTKHAINYIIPSYKVLKKGEGCEQNHPPKNLTYSYNKNGNNVWTWKEYYPTKLEFHPSNFSPLFIYGPYSLPSNFRKQTIECHHWTFLRLCWSWSSGRSRTTSCWPGKVGKCSSAHHINNETYNKV